MMGTCRECKHFMDCYPDANYIEIQLNAQIMRDLCVNNDKEGWEQKDG